MTRRVSIFGAVIAALTGLAGARPAAAQELEAPRPRQGYYLSFGMNAVVSENRDSGKGLGLWPGAGGAFHVGQLLSRRFGLGLSLDSGGGSKSGRSFSLFGLGVEGQMEVAHNLALHAEVGFGVISLDPVRPGDDVRGSYGGAFTAGATYDYFLWPHASGGWAVTPGVWLRALPGSPVTSYSAFLGVSLSYWSGLPRSHLELPPSRAFAPDD